MVAFLWFFLEKTRQQVEEQFQEEQPIKEQYKELSKRFVLVQHSAMQELQQCKLQELLRSLSKLKQL